MYGKSDKKDNIEIITGNPKKSHFKTFSSHDVISFNNYII